MILLTLTIALAGCSGDYSSASIDSAGDDGVSSGTELVAPAKNTDLAAIENSDAAGNLVAWLHSSKATINDWNNWDEAKQKDWCYAYYCNLYPVYRAKTFAPLLIVSLSRAIEKDTASGLLPRDWDLLKFTSETDLFTVRKEHKHVFED